MKRVYISETGPGVEVCWYCDGEPYRVVGHHSITFAVGDTVVELGNGLGSYRIVKRKPGGVDVLESVITGEQHDMNNRNNALYIAESSLRDALDMQTCIDALSRSASALTERMASK